MNETESYPSSDVTAQQVESLIKTTADLQTQILRKFAKSVLEEMRYHLYVAQEKCKMGEETIATLSATIEIERAAAVPFTLYLRGAGMMNQDLTCATTLAELERAAYASGDTQLAALLAQLQDRAEEIKAHPEELKNAETESFEAGRLEGRTDAREEIRAACEETIGALLLLAKKPRASEELRTLVDRLAEVLL